MSSLSPFWFKVTGTLFGILLVDSFATAQFIMVYGSIAYANYLIPSLIGAISGFLVSSIYSNLLQAKQEIKQQHQTLTNVLDNIHVGLWDWYPLTQTVEFDERCLQLMGFKPHEVRSGLEFWESRVHPEDFDACHQDMEQHIQGTSDIYSNIHRLKHKDGHWIYFLSKGHVIERNEHGKPIYFKGTLQDISEFKQLEMALEASNQKLKALSERDSLTGLFNRRALDIHLAQQIAQWHRNQISFSVCLVDIDFFKEFNDTYGHLEGDVCLQNVAKLLQDSTHRASDLVARFGGEEFVIVLTDTDSENAHAFGESVRRRILDLQIPHKSSGIENFVTVSIGIATSDNKHHSPDVASLIKNSDKALYQAKKFGRNQVISWPYKDQDIKQV